MQPRESFEAAAKERFAHDSPFSTVLTGMAKFSTMTASALAEALPTFVHKEIARPVEAPAAAKTLLSFYR